MIKIRRAEVSDAPQIAQAENAYIDCPWTERQIAEEILNPAAVFLVAADDGEFCGYVSGVISIDECEMSNIAVSESFRRRGVGKALMTELLNELANRGVQSVFLLVRDGNEPAVNLYTQCGFSCVGKRKDYYKGRDALIMRLNL